MMTLATYLTDARLTQAEFARRIGVTQTAVSKLCAGRIRPSLALAITIARETQGAVPVTCWGGDVTAPCDLSPDAIACAAIGEGADTTVRQETYPGGGA